MRNHHNINSSHTTAPVAPGSFEGVKQEFGRAGDVERVFGIGRTSCYNLIAAGKIRSVKLRVTGQKHGLRLFDMASIRSYIESCAERQISEGTANCAFESERNQSQEGGAI